MLKLHSPAQESPSKTNPGAEGSTKVGVGVMCFGVCSCLISQLLFEVEDSQPLDVPVPPFPAAP